MGYRCSSVTSLKLITYHPSTDAHNCTKAYRPGIEIGAVLPEDVDEQFVSALLFTEPSKPQRLPHTRVFSRSHTDYPFPYEGDNNNM
jgi:hypothetical protein